jgi:ketosteroid isomerase-like protein
MQRLETAIRTVMGFNEAFNRHDVAGMMRLMSDDCIYESPNPAPDGTVYTGKEVVTQFWQTFFNQLPTTHNQIEDIFSFGEHCVMRRTLSWVDATGGEGFVRGVDIIRVRGGSIFEFLSYVKGKYQGF